MGGTRVLRLLFAVLLIIGMPSAAFAQPVDTVTLTVVHAIPADDGFPADVYVNGEVAVSRMLFDAVSEPAEIPAGPTEIALYPAGTDPETVDAVLGETITLEPNNSYTLVAQLVDGTPAMALYLNDLDPVDTGVTRLTIRHTGTSGPLDVLLAGESVVADLTSPNEFTLEVPAGMQPLALSSGDGSPLFEQELDLRAGSLVVLYAVGSPDDTTDFGLLTQQVVIPQVNPTGVPTGSAGLASPQVVWLLVPISIVVLAMFAVRPRRSTA